MSTYTTTTNKLKITELDFDQIKTALKTYLSGQSEFQDYDFDYSNFQFYHLLNPIFLMIDIVFLS